VVPAFCVAEVSHLLSREGTWEAEVRQLLAIAAAEFSVEPFKPTDAERMAELVGAYCELPLGTVDASVIATAERLDIRTVATLDHCRFDVVRPAHVGAFEFLPRSLRA